MKAEQYTVEVELSKSDIFQITWQAIALDRQRVILYPLKPRITKQVGLTILAIIWMIAIFFSLPYGIYNEVMTVSLLVENVQRCRQAFPEPAKLFEKCLTLITLLLQYIVPLVYSPMPLTARKT
jgi:G protein-coupled receptor 83